MIGFERDRSSTGRALYCGLLLLATGLFFACENMTDTLDLVDCARMVKARKKTAIEALPETRTVESFVFDPGLKCGNDVWTCIVIESIRFIGW